MKTEYEKVLLPKPVQQELEKLRAQAIADAAEIARLQSGFDELKEWCNNGITCDMISIDYSQALIDMLRNINRITGVEG